MEWVKEPQSNCVTICSLGDGSDVERDERASRLFHRRGDLHHVVHPGVRGEVRGLPAQVELHQGGDERHRPARHRALLHLPGAVQHEELGRVPGAGLGFWRNPLLVLSTSLK